MSFDFNKLSQRRTLPTKVMLTIRIVLGAYLYYLVYDLRDSIYPFGNNLIITIAAVLFIIGGGIIIVFSALDLYKGRYVGGAQDPNKDNSSDN